MFFGVQVSSNAALAVPPSSSTVMTYCAASRAPGAGPAAGPPIPLARTRRSSFFASPADIVDVSSSHPRISPAKPPV